MIPKQETETAFCCAGLQKLGGASLGAAAQLQDCIAHARLRHQEVAALLQQSLNAAGVPPEPAAAMES